MILKIRHAGGWWLYDELCRVHFGLSKHGVEMVDTDRVVMLQNKRFVRLRWGESLTQEALADENAGFLPDVILTSKFNEVAAATEPAPVAWACVRDEKGVEKFFVFDEGYVLNNEGKTLEILR